jgi:hypothetical protein
MAARRSDSKKTVEQDTGKAAGASLIPSWFSVQYIVVEIDREADGP